jgi:hypothetical protein
MNTSNPHNQYHLPYAFWKDTPASALGLSRIFQEYQENNPILSDFLSAVYDLLNNSIRE